MRAQERLRILLVDQHDDFRAVFCELLRTAGHEVTMATSESTALSIAQNTKLDAALVDLNLPACLAIARLIQATVPRTVLVGACTAPWSDADAAVFDVILLKPFDAATLLAAIADARDLQQN